MSASAIALDGPRGIAAIARLRTGLRELTISWADIPDSVPPPHGPVTVEQESLLSCETRRRAASRFD